MVQFDKCFENARQIVADASRLLDNIMHSMGDGLSIQDRSMRIVYQNQFMLDHFGSHIGDHCYTIYEKRDTVCDGCPIIEAFRTGNVTKALRVGVTKDGTPFRFENIASPLRNDQGEIVAGMELCRIVEDREKALDDLRTAMAHLKRTQNQLIRDISKREQAEEKLKQSRQRYQALVENISDWVWEVDREGKYTYASPKVKDLLGYGPEEIIGKTPFDLMPPAEADRVKNTFIQSIAKKQPLVRIENINLHKQGHRVILETSGLPITNDKGELLGYRGIDRDITERKKAEAERAKLTALVETSSDFIGIATMEGNITYLNSAGRQMMGLDNLEQALNTNLFDYVPPEEQVLLQRTILPAIRGGGWWRGEAHLRHLKSHELLPVDSTCFALPDPYLGEWTYVATTMRDITERKQAEKSLQESEKRFKDITYSMAEWVWEVDKNCHYTYSSTGVRRILGYEPEELVGKKPFDLMTPDEAARAEPIYLNIASEKKPIVDLENWNLTKQGEEVCLLTNGVPRWSDKGELLGYRGVDKDITERKRAERERKQQYQNLAALNSLLTLSQETRALPEFLSRALEVTLSLPSLHTKGQGAIFLADQSSTLTLQAQHGLGENMARRCAKVAFDQCLCGRAASEQELMFAYQEAGHHQLPCELLPPHGHYCVPILWEGETLGVLNVYTDEKYLREEREEEFLATVASTLGGIIKRKDAEEELYQLARYDALTGLPNRRLFEEHLKTALARAKRTQNLVALMFMDLDHFKNVNDTLGHPVGDMLLKLVADRLIAEVRGADTVARFGGDEYAILQPDLPGLNGTGALAGRILKCLAQPYLVQGHDLHVSASIGIALYTPDRPVSRSELLAQADRALYRAKERGRNCFFFHDQEIEQELRSHVALTNALRQALQRQEFQIHYQPQVSMPDGRIVGLEALLRWRHPERGLLGPKEFIQNAEESRLIIPLGEWTLRKACRQLQTWRDQGIAQGIRMAVNLSPTQVSSPEFVSMIEKVLSEVPLPPEYLELELIEDILMEGSPEVMDALKYLQTTGATLSIDDFGTGYSSLKYLKALPISKIKIAQEFVLDLPGDVDDAAIVTTIIELGRRMNLRVIAEGVETPEQMNFLLTHGCTEAQGYYFARPQPPEALAPLLAKGKIDIGLI